MQPTTLRPAEQPANNALLRIARPLPGAALSSGQAKLLARCERTIEQGLDTFCKVGQALLDIRINALFRPKYATFESYCRERWRFSGSRARQLIAAAKTAETVTNVTLPNEGTARELAKVPEDKRQAVLDWAEEKADGAPLTANLIRESATDVMQAEPDDEPDDDRAAADRVGEYEDNRIGDFRDFIGKLVTKKIPSYHNLNLLSDSDIATALYDIADEWNTSHGAKPAEINLEPLVRSWMMRTSMSATAAAILLENVAATLRAGEGRHA
jgi:hypothetical protein